MKEAMFYEPGEDDEVDCRLCPHNCRIRQGKLGVCGVRKNIDGKLFSLSYDNVAAINVDPVEKKPLYHFYPGENILSVGTPGCNLGCEFCQNSDLSQFPKLGKAISGEKVSPEDLVKSAISNSCRMIAYTYSEPTIFYELCLDTSRIAKEHDLKNVLVSNGFINPEPQKLISPYIDAANIDLKSFSDDFYKKVCKAHLQPVLDAIRLYHKLGVWIEITTLLIDGRNDSEEELRQIAEFIASIDQEIPWHISRSYPDYLMQDLTPTPIKTMELAYRVGKNSGLKHIYLGNVNSHEHEATHCPECGSVVIDRKGYHIISNTIKDSSCPSCGAEIAGRF